MQRYDYFLYLPKVLQKNIDFPPLIYQHTRGRLNQLLSVNYKRRKPSEISLEGFLRKKNGGYLLSHGCAVPSARAGLTSLFGMGRGGTPPL